MKKNPSCVSPPVLRFALAAFGFAFSCAALSAFDSIPEEQMALMEPKVDPEAAVEFFYYEEKSVDVADSGSASSVRKTKSRLKVFKERGILTLTPTKIRYPSKMRLTDLQARVTKPDGTEIFLGKDSVDTERSDYDEDRSFRTTSLSFPNLEVGDIIDFEYSLSSLSTVYRTTYRLYNEFPSHHTRLMFQPMKIPGVGATYQTFNNTDKDWIKSKGDYYYIEGFDLPATPDEDYSPPRLHSVPSVWFFYALPTDPKFETFWEQTGQGLYRDGNGDFKASKAIEAVLKEIVAGSPNKEESLRRVYWFCQDEIANTSFGYGDITKVERDALPKKQTATQTLENKMGRPDEVRRLFGAFARALGFEVEFALLPDKRDLHFGKSYRFKDALPEKGVAVKMGSDWLVLNPGNPHLAFGQVEPWSADSLCLVGNKKKEAIFAKSNKSDADFNIMERSGTLTLDENGDLSGELEIVARGDFARGLRNRHHASSDEKWGKAVVQLLKRTFKSEFSHSDDIVVENKRGSREPVRAKFRITIPAYAERSGDSLVVRPSVLWDGWEPRFASETRESDVVLMTPSRIVDKVRIMMPEGYAFDGGAAPAPLPDNPLVDYKASLKIDPKEGSIQVERDFAEKFSFLPVRIYHVLRTIDSHIQQQDKVAITLAKKEAN